MLPRYVLASRSPRRLELLSLLVPREQIQVCPPPDPAEAGFDDLFTLPDILDRLQQIARHKAQQVAGHPAVSPWTWLISADTVVLAQSVAGRLQVLGQPAEPDWKPIVKNWFQNLLLGRDHQVVTAVCLLRSDGLQAEFSTQTTVRFHAADLELLDWYLETGEPRGKAGGYALQGAGSLFVESVTGSSSNVIGLPLEPIWATFQRWKGIPFPDRNS